MKTSENFIEITKALLEFQKQTDFVEKTTNNTFFQVGKKFHRYAKLGDVLDSVKPILNKLGIIVTQSIDETDHNIKYLYEEKEDLKTNKFIKRDVYFITLTTKLIHISGEWLESVSVVPIQKNDPQGIGSGSQYIRRYALLALLGLYEDEDDDGNKASTSFKKEVKTVPFDTEKFNSYLINIYNAKDLEQLKNTYNEAYRLYPNNIEEITKAKDERKSQLTKE